MNFVCLVFGDGNERLPRNVWAGIDFCLVMFYPEADEGDESAEH